MSIENLGKCFLRALSYQSFEAFIGFWPIIYRLTVTRCTRLAECFMATAFDAKCYRLHRKSFGWVQSLPYACIKNPGLNCYSSMTPS
jgi:hypothetical protein